MFSLFDIHCHLYDLPDLDETIVRARDSGVIGALCVSENLETMKKALDLKSKYPDFIHAGLGLHPADAMRLSPLEIRAALRFMEEHLEEAAMVGEIGLDYKYAETPEQREFQKHVLKDQLELAAKFRKGINLHSRRAQREVMEEAAAYHERTGLPALLHWFTHSTKLTRRAVEAGLFISVGPEVLYSEQTLKTALTIPLDNLALETDTPVEYSGVSARPHQVADVARALSEAAGISMDNLSLETGANAMKLLGK